ncbi:MAG: hypothetical protein CV089_02115 [Nitrospira sp. WS110]|nr:hypothetical protein [Nitrospira sp. WS110]
MADNRTTDEQHVADQRVREARSGLNAYLDATADLRPVMMEDEKFVVGGKHQWREEDITKLKGQQRPIQTYNITKSIVDFVCGYQGERETDPIALPRGSEDAQLGLIMSALLKFCFDRSSSLGKHELRKLFRGGTVSGQRFFEMGPSYDFTDDIMNGDLVFNTLPLNSVAHELGARRYDLNDAAWLTKLMWMDPAKAKEMWPRSANVLTMARARSRDWIEHESETTGTPSHLTDYVDEEHNRIRILQRWYHKRHKVTLAINKQTGEIKRFETGQAAQEFQRHVAEVAGTQAAQFYQLEEADSQSALVNQVTGRAHTFVTPDGAMQQLDMLRKEAGRAALEMFRFVQRPTTQLHVAHFTGWELLDDGPGYGDWRYPIIPFTLFQDSEELDSIQGLVRPVKDPQRELNWHYATILDGLVRGPKSSLWLPQTFQGDLAKLQSQVSRHGFIGQFAGQQPPVQLGPAAISREELEMLQFCIEIMMRIANVNAEMLGQTTQKTVSGRAIGARQQGGLVALGTVFSNWQETLRLIFEMAVRFIQKMYPPEKMMQIIGQRQKVAQSLGMYGSVVIPDEVIVQKLAQIPNIDYDMVVSFQDASPSARQAAFVQLQQMRGVGIPVPLQILVDASDVPHKEEIQATLAAVGPMPPDPNAAKAASASQGQTAPDGVNTSQ